MCTILCLLTPALASPLKTREMFINTRKFFPNGNTPYLTKGRDLGYELNINHNIDVFKLGYFNYKVWSLTDQTQFRWVGLNFKAGIRLTSIIDIEYEHFSKHILDDEYPYKAQGNNFPVEDSIGVNIYLMRDKPNASIF